ncbi:MAG: hypothetical protein JWQ91_1766 [Aeromicrobium sp.]|uniref:DUF2079 domain-containing protein n=1 Tax=Aeromicrobium sp. TaxID=1871063 RepID=UPI00262FFAB7|nr:DUF2079 domain-containing protein [Aeromicrobium sp.]MCW2824849.1 hypothetical protein [Aeromicrobium sp.]
MTATHRQRLLAALVALAAAAAYAAVTLLRFGRYTISSFDNAIFEQAIKSYAHLGAPVVDIKAPGYNILGDHFSPITALVAPVYRLVPSAQTVLLAQVVLIAVSIHVVAVLGMRRLGTAVGLAIGVAYAVSFGVQSAIEADFHEVAFAAPLLALAGAAYVDRRFDRVVWWSLPLLLVKEDLGVTVAAIGIVLWLSGDRRRGPLLAIGGVVATALVVLVVIPFFNTAGSYAYADDGGLLSAAFDGLGRKAATVLLTFGVTGLAALGSPWALVAVPTLLWRFTGDVPYYWGTDYHYSLVLMPIVFVAAIDAIERRPRLRWTVPAGLVVGGVLMVGSPLATLVDSTTYDEPPRAHSARAVLTMVPEGASVETDIGLMSHLVTDHTVYWIGSIGDTVPDYVLLDVLAGIGSPVDVEAYAEQAHGGEYDVVFDEDGFVLAARRPPNR